MSNKLRVIGATLDTKQLTLYKEDGKTVIIPQGDHRIKRIVDEILPIVRAGGVAEVDISEDNINVYNQFEEKTGGVVKFFRIAKKKLKEFFNGTKEEDSAETPETFDLVGQAVDVSKEQAAIDEIMANATPSTSPDFRDVELPTHDDVKRNIPQEDAGDTIIAVVDGKKIVPDAHKINHQIVRANQIDNTIGVENFLKRVASVIDRRRHSVEDLMHHLKRGDMQFANDGSIIAYKILKTKSRDVPTERDTYFDCHSGNVPQKIGSFVHMDENMVDPNRRNECSNGLHIARRQYLGGFSGNVCVLIKIAPEDVIAVPEYDANKMRVCGYHILFLLDPNDVKELRAGNRLSSAKAQQQLAKAISGNHVGKLESVKITGPYGSGIQITPHTEGKAALKEVREKTSLEDGAASATPLDENKRQDQAPALDPTDVAEKVATERQLSRKEQAGELYERWISEDGTKADLDKLLAFKKQCKVGWDKLGIPFDANGPLMPTMGVDPAAPGTDRTVVAGQDAHQQLVEVVAQVAVKKSKPKAPKKPAKAKKVVSAPTPKESAPKTTKVGPSAQISKLIADGPMTIGKAKEISAIKKAAKKSWEALGVSQATLNLIEGQLKNKPPII